MSIKEYPVVTCAVLSYFSDPYVIETLESIYELDYPELDLLISDDCSADNTIPLCDDWVNQSRVKKRFRNINILTIDKNGGVSANMNRAIKAAKTDWIKIISADDILLPNCLKDNLNFVASNPKAKAIFSQVKMYQDVFEERNFSTLMPDVFPDNIMKPEFTAEDQWKILLESDRINNTPSFFFHKSVIEKVGYYDETNRLVEDSPMWLKLTKAGVLLHYFHKPTVGYRIHSKALNNVGDKKFIQPSFIRSYEIRKSIAHPFLPTTMVWKERYVVVISKIFVRIKMDVNNTFNTSLYRLLTVYLNPFHYIESIGRKVFNYKTKIKKN